MGPGPCFAPCPDGLGFRLCLGDFNSVEEASWGSLPYFLAWTITSVHLLQLSGIS